MCRGVSHQSTFRTALTPPPPPPPTPTVRARNWMYIMLTAYRADQCVHTRWLSLAIAATVLQLQDLVAAKCRYKFPAADVRFAATVGLFVAGRRTGRNLGETELYLVFCSCKTCGRFATAKSDALLRPQKWAAALSLQSCSGRRKIATCLCM